MPLDWIGLIPAAGKGLRLGLPYPKELYPIIRHNRYKPISQFIVDQMLAVGVKHIVFVINETKHQLIGYYGNGIRFGCHFSYVVQERVNESSQVPSPGLANALDSAFHLTQGKMVFFGMPDTIIKPMRVFERAVTHIETCDLVMCLFPTTTPQKFGMVRYTDKASVIEVIDKPRATELTEMWGCLLWKPIFTAYLHQKVSINSTVEFASILNKAIIDGISLKGVVIKKGSYVDIGTFDEIMRLDQGMKKGEDW